MRAILIASLLAAAAPQAAHAFCGFYAGKADATLFNEASQVIMVRDGNRTVLTMLNDYKGELTEFALVVPVPVVLKQNDIRVADKKIFERIDAYSSPRLAEYFDGNPCDRRRYRMDEKSVAGSAPRSGDSVKADKAHGVTVEAQYTVGEYDIVILSAAQSDGLETWLTQNGYRIPKGASAALRPYIMQNMKFFVARVNLKEQSKTGASFLRPLQFSFDSEKFMLPMRLGMINANGPQDLIVYALTRKGRVEIDQLPHGEIAGEHGSADLAQIARRVRQVLQGHVRPAREARELPRGVHRIRLGHGLVRSLCRRSALGRRTQGGGRFLGG